MRALKMSDWTKRAFNLSWRIGLALFVAGAVWQLLGARTGAPTLLFHNLSEEPLRVTILHAATRAPAALRLQGLTHAGVDPELQAALAADPELERALASRSGGMRFDAPIKEMLNDTTTAVLALVFAERFLTDTVAPTSSKCFHFPELSREAVVRVAIEAYFDTTYTGLVLALTDTLTPIRSDGWTIRLGRVGLLPPPTRDEWDAALEARGSGDARVKKLARWVLSRGMKPHVEQADVVPSGRCVAEVGAQ